jgi:hypothetical protein
MPFGEVCSYEPSLTIVPSLVLTGVANGPDLNQKKSSDESACEL